MRSRVFNDRDGREWQVREVDEALTFESRGERRRMSPVPHSWTQLARAELMMLLASAELITFLDRADISLLK